MKEIKYEAEGGKCLTPCPYYKSDHGLKAGSVYCYDYCEHHVHNNTELKIVTCSK